MSPGPHHFDFPGFSATLPARKGSSASLCHRPSRLSDVTPPPINRNLKPNRKCEFLTAKFSLRTFIIYKVCIVSCSYKDNDFCWLCLVLFSTAKPTPLDLKNNGIIDELPFKSPVTMSWTRPMWVSYKWFELGYPRQLHAHTHTHKVWMVQIGAAFCFPSRSCLLCFRAAMNSMSSQHCRPISTQSITSTDSADSEENYVAMVSPNSWRGDRESTLCSLF